MKFKFWLVCAGIFCLSTEHAATFHVALTGDDQNVGSDNAPLRTIQKAATLAQPGDTVLVRGGTYRESVTPPRSGLAGAPIVFRAAPGEEVTINGTEIVKNWRAANGKIYQATLAGDHYPSKHNYAEQIFVDGAMVNLARWPNTTLDVSNPVKSTLTKFISKTRDKATNWTTAIFEDENLPDNQSFVGAEIFIQPNREAWSWALTGTIVAQNGKHLTLQSRSDTGQDGKQEGYAVGSRYYLFNQKQMLDSNGEWWHDRAANTLYLQTPNGDDANQHVIEARQRDFAFDLSDKSYLTIQGFHLFACTITTDPQMGSGIEWDTDGKDLYPWRNSDSLPPSHHIVLDGLNVLYPSHFTEMSGHFFLQWGTNSGLNISGISQTIQNCRIQFSAGNGISCYGRQNKILNNVIEDTAYSALDLAPINTTGGVGAFDFEIAYNTIRRCGRSGMSLRGLQNSDVTNLVTRVHHNDVGAFMLQDFDGGATYTFGQDAKFARVDHNWFHDATGPTVSGFYIDYSKNWIVDHNVIWNVEWAIHLEGAHTSGVVDALVFNNTALARSSSIGIGNGQAPGSFYFNNIFNRDIGKAKDSASEIKNNLFWDNQPNSPTDPKFTGATDFQLQANSPARDTGAIITQFSTQQPGNTDLMVPFTNEVADGKPDIGAYEFGENWTAGSTLGTTPRTPNAPEKLVAFAPSANRVNLSWATSVESGTSVSIERKTGVETFAPIATGLLNVSDFFDNKVAPGTTYVYRLRAGNNAGASPYSEQIIVATPLKTIVDARIAHTQIAPQIDGQLDDVWEKVPAQKIDNVLNGEVDSDADLSGWWKALWDEQNLYIVVDVTDDAVTFNAEPAWYTQDGIEIYLDADASKKKSYDFLNDYQLAFLSNGNLNFGQNSARKDLELNSKVVKTATGYRLEVAVSWAQVLGHAPVVHDLIGFDVHIADNEDGVNWQGKKSWFTKTNSSWLDPSLFGTAELVD